jgi:magnesium transporter
VKIDLFDYDAEKLDIMPLASVEEAYPSRDTETVSWINIIGLHDPEILKSLDSHFGIH